MSGLPANALESAKLARLALENELYGSACSNAYFAMFNAARMLLEELEGIERKSIKRHATVLSRFSLCFVHTGRFDAEVARALGRGSQLRSVFDCDDIITEEIDPRSLVGDMEKFLVKAEQLLEGRETK
ncbi:MAG: HEPN domain-containing protein [Beijerinckiaceae bacterium]